MDAVHRRAATTLFVAAGIAYLLDRVSKMWAERALPGHPIDLGVLTLRFTSNSGGAFSIGRSSPLLFVAATVIVSTLIVIAAFRQTSPLRTVALGLVLGGALGNLTDRLVRAPGLKGTVVDFVDLRVWPIFNVADSCIVVGGALLVVAMWRADRAATPQEDADA